VRRWGGLGKVKSSVVLCGGDGGGELFGETKSPGGGLVKVFPGYSGLGGKGVGEGPEVGCRSMRLKNTGHGKSVRKQTVRGRKKGPFFRGKNGKGMIKKDCAGILLERGAWGQEGERGRRGVVLERREKSWEKV